MATLQFCIPTYQRQAQLLKTLTFLDQEITPELAPLVSIRVLDNASDYDVKSVVKSRFPHIKVDVNEVNIGVDGSYLRLAHECTADYIQIIGDDDIYLPGYVAAIVEAIHRPNVPDYVFLNHRGRWPDGRVAMNSMLPAAGLASLLDVFNVSGTQLMFLGASVFRHSKLIAALNAYDGDLKDETFPLGLALYAGRDFDKIAIVTQPYVENIWGLGFWEIKKERVFHKSVPEELIRAKQYGYSAEDVMTSLMFHQTRYAMAPIEWLRRWPE
jgi:glycosyltransferase involved in cell wall biosynthesis